MRLVDTSFGRLLHELGHAIFPGRVVDSVLGHSLRSSEGGDDILGVSGDAMLVDVEAFEFAFFGDAKPSEEVKNTEDGHCNCERCRADDAAADALTDEDFPTTAIEQAGEGPTGRAVSHGDAGGTAACGRVFTAGEQTERERSPDAAQTVNRPCTDGIIDAEEFKQVDTEDHDDPGNSAQDACAGGADPVAGAGDGDETGQEAVGDRSCVPLFGAEGR